MRIATVDQCKKIDRVSQDQYEIPAEVLMEAAGCSAARELEFSFYPELKKGTVGIVCGPGNNGGDGLVLARHLHSTGHRDLTIFIIGELERRTELFLSQYRRVELIGVRVVDLQLNPQKMDQIKSCSLLIDALFGIGLDRRLEGEFAKLVDVINSAKVPVVSLDNPSGLDCDRGVVMGTAVKSVMTLPFGLAKPGFFVGDGPQHVGRIRILNIGFPHEAMRSIALSHFAFSERLARRALPLGKETRNKSDFGRLLICAGQPGTWGAGILSASAGYRVGAGYVTLASFEEPREVVKEHPEFLTTKIKEINLKETPFSAFAIGPGLGVSEETANLIQFLKEKKCESVVIDADALTTCVQFNLFPLPNSWVITPHSGELSRIIKVDAKVIDTDRYNYALQAAEQVGCHVLLKGYRSVLAYGDRCMVILSGNSALAKAGTGDVLTGMIGGFMAQGVPPLQATAAAAYIHGRMADEWVRVGNDKRSLTASDLRDHLPRLMGSLREGALI